MALKVTITINDRSPLTKILSPTLAVAATLLNPWLQWLLKASKHHSPLHRPDNNSNTLHQQMLLLQTQIIRIPLNRRVNSKMSVTMSSVSINSIFNNFRQDDRKRHVWKGKTWESQPHEWEGGSEDPREGENTRCQWCRKGRKRDPYPQTY